MATAPSPVLHHGDDGPAVTKLQTGLTELGFNAGRPDGVFGRQTDAALRDFQRAIGVDVDGVYGRRTEAALIERLKRHGDDRDRVREPPVVRSKTASLPLTSSVQRIAARADLLTAVELAGEIWNDHPDYPARQAIVSLVGRERKQGVARSGADWVSAVVERLDPVALARIKDPRDRVLHGKLLIYGLSRLDHELHHYLSDAGALDELRRSITPDPETLFPPPPETKAPAQHEAREPQPPPEPSQNARLVADNPATEDLLDREGFANAMAVLIDLQRADTRDPISGPILIHLYGAWGSGKTTLFGLLRRSLESPSEGLEPRRKGWLCATFNAWGHQRTAPPWWWLMDGVYREATARRRQGHVDPLSRWRRLRIWIWWWRDALVALLAGASLLVCSVIFGIVTIDRMAGAKDAVNIIVGLFVAAGSAVALVRSTKSSLLIGSPRGATALLRSGGDPYRRIRNRYAKLIEKTGRNVLVFIDDLDRCQPDYVVELLEGVQTIFDDTAVTHLVAADRDWVSESFQRVYADLGSAMDRPGRPLGYLFLEKTFAVSAPLPRPSPAAQARYWQAVLTGDALGRIETITARNRRTAHDVMAKDSPEQAAARAAELATTDLSGEARAIREKAAIKMAEAVTTGEQDHILAPYLPLLDPNPRALKRLRNAYAIATMSRFASLDIATSDRDVDALVRWTILTLRWPWLASRVVEQPRTLDAILHRNEVALDGELAAIARDEDLMHLLHEPVANGVSPGLESWLATELGGAPADSLTAASKTS